MQNWLGGGGGGTTCIYMYKQHSIVITGNFNADFKLLTHNRYSVLNGHFVRQIHPSSLLKFEILLISQTKPLIKFRKYLLKSSQSLFYKKIKICTHIKPLTTPPIFKLINQSAHRYTWMGRIRGYCTVCEMQIGG